jgi:probable HAF family extracellular repeat protein
MISLGILPGGTDSRALAVDEDGRVVGFCRTPSGNRAFLWDKANGMRDLNNLVDAKYRATERLFFDARAIRTDSSGITKIVSRHLSGACVFKSEPEAVNMAELE